MLQDLRSELLPAVESDIYSVAMDPSDIIAATESYFTALLDVEKEADAIELTQTGARVLDEAVADIESDRIEDGLVKANTVAEVLVGSPIIGASVEADDKDSVLDKIKAFLKKVLNFIKEKAKQLWNKILVLVAKAKNLVVANVQQKFFIKKLDKFLEKCGKGVAKDKFTADEIKELAKDLYPYAENGVVNKDVVVKKLTLDNSGAKIIDDIERRVGDIRGIAQDYEKINELAYELVSKSVTSLRDGSVYTINEDLRIEKAKGAKPENVKDVAVLEGKAVEDLKKHYDNVAKDLLSSGIKEYDKKVKRLMGIFDKLPDSVNNLKEEDKDKYEELKKALDLYKNITLNVLPKMFVIVSENFRAMSAPKFGKWLDMSCEKLDTDKKEEDKKETDEGKKEEDKK